MSLEHSIVCPVLVGRAGPLEALTEALERARGGEGSIVIVSGEAGVGKSRLVRAATDAARGDGFLVMEGVSFESDRALPFAPLLDLVRDLAASTSPGVAAHALAPAGPELLALFPELRWVFDGVEPAPPTGPEHGRRRLLHALAVAFELLSRRQPLLLVFEDVHWSDDATLELLPHLARAAAGHPIVLAATLRSDEIGSRVSRVLAELDRTRLTREIALAPLAIDEVAEMLRAIFGPSAAPGDDFPRTLHDLTEGNPFFVEEVLKALIVTGELARSEEGPWRVRPLERMQVPRSALEAVRRRLSGLSAPANELLSLAAVTGRHLDFALLRDLSGHEEPVLLGLLKELVGAQLMVEESAERIAFRHALTREAIYSELLARERMALHRRVATVLARQHASALDGVVAALAYHTFEAGEWGLAREYGARAAERAMALNAPRDALTHLDRALTAARNEGREPDEALLLTRARARETLGDFVGAHADLSAVLAQARAGGSREDEWEALHGLGRLWAARDYVEAGEYRQEALALARALGDPARIARGLDRLGNWHVNLERPAAARRYLEEALPLLERLGDERGVAETVDAIGMVCHIAGDEVEAVRWYGRAVEMFTMLDHRGGLAIAQTLTALSGPSLHCSATRFGRSEMAARVLDTGSPVQLAQEIGWRAGESFCGSMLADCFIWRGAYDRGIPLARSALAIAEEIGHLEWAAAAASVLGVAALDLFDLEGARALLDRARGIAVRLGSGNWTRWAGAPLAIVHAHLGDTDTALAVLDADEDPPPLRRVAHRPGDEETPTLGQRYLRLARAEVLLARGEPARALELVDARIAEEVAASRRDSPPGSLHVTSRAPDAPARLALPRYTFLRARALLALERLEEAETALTEAIEEAEVAESAPLLWRAHATLGQLHRIRRRRTAARVAFDTARRIAGELAERVPDEALRASFRRGIDALAPAPAALTPRKTAKAAHGGLTRRECEVARLVARGASNRAIARQLGIAVRTVESHVANSLAKRGFSSRAQLAAWAVHAGLAPDAGSPPPPEDVLPPPVSP